MPKPSANQLLIALLMLLLTGGLVWWFLANFKQVSYTERTAMSAEARRNPLLAAQRLLEGLGHKTESQSGRQYLIHPPQQTGVLLVRELGAPLPQERVDDLLVWVEAGGHLIAAPGRLHDAELSRPLLEHFGVSHVYQWRFEELEWFEEVIEQAQTEQQEQMEQTEQAERTTSISLPVSEKEPLNVEFDNDFWFEVDYPYNYWRAPDDEPPHLLIFPYGEGYVTFLSDSDYFDNRHIGDYDHAPLLAELVAGHERAYERVWLLYSSQMPGLLQLLWRWAPYLVVSVVLSAGLLIWRMGRRSGPLIISGQQQRRDLLEHLQASAEFNWRIDPSAGLLQQARKQVERRWLASHPQLQRLDEAARCHWLAKRTGMTPEAIDLALYRSRKETGQLVKASANLQRLLAALHSQSKKR